jgi:MSHA biogenesis protein MshN
MSVINRMLTDLERRGAPGARRQRPADAAADPQSRQRARRWLQRLGPPALLVALVAVAAALWLEQWPHVRALVDGPREPAATEPAATEDGTSPEPRLAAVRRFGFERDEAGTRMVIAFDRPLTVAPGYGRRGDRVELQLPARRNGVSVPAPPEGQSVYRTAIVDERGDEGIRIGMRVDPEARFDLAIDGDRLTLTGRVPAAPAREVQTDDVGASGAERAAVADSGNTRNGAAGTDGTGSGQRASADTGGPSVEGAETDATEPVAAVDVGSAAAPAGDGATATTGGGADNGAGSDVAANGEAPAREGPAAGEAEGRVRKSEPDIDPRERARRLEASAREALDEGDIAAARDHLATALEFDGARHSARDLLVGLALRSGNPDAARNLLAEGVARAPGRAAYAKPYARLLVDAGDLERALRVLRRAAPATRDDAGYHGLTAAVAQRLKRHELAASEYTRALEIDSGRGVWWMGLGISLRATGHPDEARAAFREARASGDLNERLDRWVQQRIEALSRTGE